jgi:hypothetical protein
MPREGGHGNVGLAQIPHSQCPVGRLWWGLEEFKIKIMPRFVGLRRNVLMQEKRKKKKKIEE